MAFSSWHDRLFRALLKLFPREFRGDFGDQMEDDFREQRADAASRGSLARVWARTLADIVLRAPREHAEVLRRDAAYAVRLFRRRPGMTASALVTLAVGIGLNAAAYAVISDVLWRSLPLPDSDRLVRVNEFARPATTGTTISGPTFAAIRQESRTLDALAGIGVRSGTIVLQDGAEEFLAAAVSQDFFRIMNVRPVLGRLLNDGDYGAVAAPAAANGSGTAPAVAPVMVISYDLWQRQFGGRADVIGQKVDLGSGGTVEVVGIAPREFVTPIFRNAVAWVPNVPDHRQTALGLLLVGLGRLAPGVSEAQAQAELEVITQRVVAANPKMQERSVQVVSLRDSITAGVRTQLWFLFATACCVLLIACANVSNLLLTLIAGRRRELATRLAVGASRAHLVRQAVTEGLVLSLAGGLIGFVLARWAVPALIAVAPASIPRLTEIHAGFDVLIFTIVVSAVVGVVAGSGAAFASSRSVLDAPLRTSGAAGRQGRRLRSVLIVSEVALALMLAVAAGLLVQTIRAVTALPLGFDPDRVIAASIPQGHGQRTKSDFDAHVVAAIRKLPGVVAAGVGSRPLGPGGMGTGITLPSAPETSVDIRVEPVGTGYLEALGARVVEGRFFTDRDHATAPRVALVNETAARALWDGQAVGRTFTHNRQPVQIVGVLGNIRHRALEEDIVPTVYFPDVQTANFWSNTLLIRSAGDPRQLLPAIRTAVRGIDPTLPVSRVETLEDRLAAATAPRRFTLWLVGLFSVVGILLAAVGVYGVVNESVVQRVPEIGVRMTLGATPGSVVGLIVRDGALLIVAGVALGAIAARAAHGVMSSFVFGVQTTDVRAFVVAAGVLMTATVAACLLPARRAARVDPVVALRQE
ncbi:MAG TPA: ABC transporter permease [Vicinamibacterales bacterium]|nr:ABC transporter permease [Vicinamibacterales bacterium]